MSTIYLVDETDTRSRILMSALRLFRKHGYHGVGITEILELAQAPKGSMYHHFPGGKEEIGVAVISKLAQDILNMMSTSRARSTEALIGQVGEQLATVMQKTQFELCSLFSGFVAERKASPLLSDAVARAYECMIELIASKLQNDGLNKRQAKERATLIASLLEGGAILSQAQQSTEAFKLAVKQAALLCRV